MMEVDGFTILDLFLTGWWGRRCKIQIYSTGGSGNTGFTYTEIKEMKWSYLQRHLEKSPKHVWNKIKVNWLSVIARKLTPKLAKTFEIHKTFLKPNFTQLFEANKVNQIEGIKWTFSLSPTD